MATSARVRETSFQRQMMRDHNVARAAAGAAPLVWNEGLAADAGAYARHLARTERFEHAPRIPGRAVQGENLWMGTRHAYSYATMTGAWTSEANIYRPGRFPYLSRTGSWHDVGHFTQIIWANTRSVGCAIAGNARDEYLVCRYFPAGNVWGQNPLDGQKTAATSFANASAR